ncbi:MAG TPA: PAS domain-containing sensor histidine kinase [Acidimicrobiales bacterium]|nr:PAS domain-containing sensor histidine kinase [Acidimicrobiales bacterium]
MATAEAFGGQAASPEPQPPEPQLPEPQVPGPPQHLPASGGLYDKARRRLPLFAAAGCVSVAFALIPFPASRTWEVVTAIAAFMALTTLTFVLPWPRLPTWSWPVVPVGYIGVVALLRDAQGGGLSGLGYLFFLPVVWLALYGRRSHLVVGLVAMAVALVVPIVAVGAPQYPASQWRLVAVTLVVATVVSFSFLFFVSRDRAYVVDLAEQSRLARRAASSAEAAREQLDSLLRAATETAVIGCDQDGLVTFFSAGAQKILGYGPEEVVGTRTVFDFIDPDELSRRGSEVDELVAAADGRAPSAVGEESVWTYVRKDGTRRKVAGVLTSRRTADGSRGYVVVAGDVTERDLLATERERLLAAQREVTQALVDQNVRLRELTKVKDDVVAAVSHELRTPLTSIRGFAELLLADPGKPLDDDQAHMVRTIERGALHLLQVADDLLADPGAGHGRQLQFVDADLAAMAAEAADAVRLLARQRAVTVSVVANQPVVIHGDPARLHQLLGNLLDNAVKFTGTGGRVMVRVSRHSQVARMDVLDDGPGIPPAERSQLFERFYRLASAAKQGIPGTGLGLAIAKSVVDAHDGTIDIVDTAGWSTTFRVHLPLTRRQAQAAPAEPAEPAEPAGHGTLVREGTVSEQ